MSREVRKVAAGWQHPKLNDKLFVPLMDGSRFVSDSQRYEENRRMWELGMVRDPLNAKEWITRREAGICQTCFHQYYGNEPHQDQYMPVWKPEEATQYMLYETLTLGTPLSPAFPTENELADWCVTHKVTLCPTRRLTFTGWLQLCHGFTFGQLMREKINTILIEDALLQPA
jgi:hypothetical protein